MIPNSNANAKSFTAICFKGVGMNFGKGWEAGEDDVLEKDYLHSNQAELMERLPGRSWRAIRQRAYKMGFGERSNKGCRMASLGLLLQETPEAYYWMGFLLADGCFSGNVLALTLQAGDVQHVRKFCEFLQCKEEPHISQRLTPRGELKDYAGVAFGDADVIPKIREKFGLSPRKTYNPPAIPAIPNSMMVPLIIGYFDGDGNIETKSGMHHVSMQVRCHASWRGMLQKFSDVVTSASGTVGKEVKINRRGMAHMIWSDYRIAQYLKRCIVANSLPALARKWDRVDETVVGRVERGIITRQLVAERFRDGKTNKEIADELGKHESYVRSITGKLKG